MLSNRSNAQIPDSLFATISTILKEFYISTYGDGFLQAYLPGFFSTLLFGTIELILAVFGIFLCECESFACYQQVRMSDLLRILYFYSVHTTTALHYFLIFMKYNHLLDTDRSREDIINSIIKILISLIIFHFATAFLYYIDDALKIKLEILVADTVLILYMFSFIFLSAFLSYPRKLKFNEFLANALSAIISLFIINSLC